MSMLDQSAYHGPERRWIGSHLRIGGLEIPYVGMAKAIETIDRSFQDRRRIRVAFCNANTMLKTLDSRKMMRAMSRFLVLNDGIGVDLCSRLFNGRPFEENLNGTDFTPALLEASRRDLRIFLFGAKPGVADEAAAKLRERFPRHQIVGVRHGYFAPEEAGAVVAEINAAKADLVLVALGNPTQELFVAEHATALEAPVVIMVGALFDFIAGRAVRAPKIVRAIRAEWLFRLAREPRRLGRRYTIDVVRFFAKIVVLKLRQRAAPEAESADRRMRAET